jgi:sugar/nucleoside kinase (ribokinase family)
VVEEGEKTGVSVILVSGEGGRSIVTYRGASRMLTRKDVAWDRLKTKWLHISSLGGRLALLEELLGWAVRNKVKVALNPGGKEIRQNKRLSKCLQKVEVLLLNREEAAKLTGNDFADEKVYKSKLAIPGPKISVVTAGKSGGKVCFEDKCLFYSTSKVKPVSNVGAGDAFGSGFVAALIYGKKIEEAIVWGKKNAEAVVRSLSSKAGLLSLAEIQTRSS